MGWRMGLLGKKVGLTQMFDEKGNWSAVTAVEVGPCVVLDIKTKQRDGYAALQLGFDEQKPWRTTKPLAGIFAKANTTPKRIVRELRLSEEETAQFKIGETLAASEVFAAGDIVDVTGRSRGKGFQGVIKRHHFSGFRASHGTHEYFRHGGSIGCRLTPARVRKGQRMAGQLGNRQSTVQNVRVTKVLPDKNLLLIHGAVPGAPDGYVLVKHAVKASHSPFIRKTAAEPAAPAGNAAPGPG